MPGMKGHGYTWSKSWIEFKAPDAPGVYCVRDKEGKMLLVGKGKIRERLLSHWNRENSTDEAIWNHAPATFQFELTNNPAQREAELIQELKPLCNPIAPLPILQILVNRLRSGAGPQRSLRAGK